MRLPLTPDSSSRPAVLVVEDDATVRTTICAALTLVGLLPLQAGNVDAALKVLGAERIDAIVLDVRLPDTAGLRRSGLSLLRFLRATAEYATVPVLLFTSHPLSMLEAELVRINRGQVFRKPDQLRDVVDTLNLLLSRAANEA
jgi:DNA-binding response OmpR family regulator